jgi:hypothetical protein
MSGRERHQFQFVYECEYVNGEIMLNPEEHDEFKWVKVEELGKYKMIAFLQDLYKEILVKEK